MSDSMTVGQVVFGDGTAAPPKPPYHWASTASDCGIFAVNHVGDQFKVYSTSGNRLSMSNSQPASYPFNTVRGHAGQAKE